MTKYKREANQIMEQYFDLLDGANQDKAIDLVNVLEQSYAKVVALIACVLYDHMMEERPEDAHKAAKLWVEDCKRDVARNIDLATQKGFQKFGWPSPLVTDANADLVAEIMEKIRGDAESH